MNTELRKKAKNYFEKYLFKLMNNSVFGRTMENVRKQRYQACNNQKKKESSGVRTSLSYNKTIHREFTSNENRKTKVAMNKPVYLGLSVLGISNIVIYKFFYEYETKKQNLTTWIQIAL